MQRQPRADDEDNKLFHRLTTVIQWDDEESLNAILDVPKYNRLLNSEDELGNTLVYYATSNRYNALKCLVERGANIELGSGYPLNNACEYGYLEIVRFLLNHGANVNGRVDSNHPPLADAVVHHQIQCVRLLLQHGADPNKLGSYQISPLLRACMDFGRNNEYMDIAIELILAGASVDEDWTQRESRVGAIQNRNAAIEQIGGRDRLEEAREQWRQENLRQGRLTKSALKRAAIPQLLVCFPHVLRSFME